MSLPAGVADEILDVAAAYARGFGSVRVEVGVGATVWRTSIVPSKAQSTFVLPVKKAVRNAEGLTVGGMVPVRLRLVDLDPERLDPG